MGTINYLDSWYLSDVRLSGQFCRIAGFRPPGAGLQLRPPSAIEAYSSEFVFGFRGFGFSGALGFRNLLVRNRFMVQG